MAVLSVDEVFEARAGSWGVEDGRSFTRAFRVITNNPYDGPNVAILSTGINRGDQYVTQGSDANLEVDLYAYCNRISSVQEEGDPLGWLVTVEYGPYSSLWAGGGPKQNPLLQPIDVSWSVRDQESVTDMDIFGDAVLNAAGDPYDPPLMDDSTNYTITVIRNEATVNSLLMQTYFKAINSDIFAGYPPLMVKLVSMLPKSIFHQDLGWYYQMTYEFECLSPLSPYTGINGWRRTVLNEGIRAISAVTGDPYHVTLKGVPVTEPVLLDANGYYGPKNAPYWNVYQLRPELPFAAFNFDETALDGSRTGFGWGYGPQ